MFFLAYLYSAGTHHGNLHSTGWHILFCGPTLEPVLATANTEKKSEEVLEKMQVNGLESRNKDEIPSSKHSMYGYILT